MADATTESWEEVALLTLDDGVTKQNFALITESFEIKLGEKNIEGLPLVNGGRVAKWKPETDTEFTAKICPIGTGSETQTSMEGFLQRFQPQATPDNLNPTKILNTRLRNKYTVAIMWADTLPADATAVTVSEDAYRIAIQNAYVTANPHTFTTSDGLMADITIKCPAFTKAGAANVVGESCDATTTLPALSFTV